MCFIDKQHNSCRCENGPLLILLLPIWWFCYRNGRFIYLFIYFNSHNNQEELIHQSKRAIQHNNCLHTALVDKWRQLIPVHHFPTRERHEAERKERKEKITAITIVTCNCLEFSFGMTRCNCKKRENTKSHRLLSIFIILFFLPPQIKVAALKKKKNKT
jgi:hypothetical protein